MKLNQNFFVIVQQLFIKVINQQLNELNNLLSNLTMNIEFSIYIFNYRSIYDKIRQ